MSRTPNHRLAELLAEAKWSNAGLAQRSNDRCEARGSSRSYTATSVANWLSGMVPSDPTPQVLAELFSERLGRRIGMADLGFPEEVPVDLGMSWESTARATVDTVAKMWRADMHRRSFLVGSTFVSSAFIAPTRDWLLGWFEDDDASHAGGRRIGETEVDVMWSMCHSFAAADQRLGGGHARSTLIHYVNNVVHPVLEGTYTEATGRKLMAAAARLADLGGFMAFDSASQGMAQRYYIQALRLAHASGDRVLGAHILGDMSMQAQYLGEADEALALARAGQRSAKDSGSYSSLARCAALEARAHALQKNANQCASAMSRAEAALGKVRPEDEPFWIKFFTVEQLNAEFAYAAQDLRRPGDVERFSTPVLRDGPGMERRRVLVTATLAASHVQAGDIDQACEVGREALRLVRDMTSDRGSQAINDVRWSLRPFKTSPLVKDFEELARDVLDRAA